MMVRMPPTNKMLTSFGYGLVDLGLDLYPITVSGYNVQDIVRIGSTLGGFAAYSMGYYSDITETLFYSSLPLTIKSVYKLVSGALGGGATKRVTVGKPTLKVMPVPAAQRKKLEFIGVR